MAISPRPGDGRALLRSELYELELRRDPPPEDKVAIVQDAGGERGNNAVYLRMSLPVAESNGLAVLSDPFPIKPGRRYRIQFRYRSDNSMVRAFVKGYTQLSRPPPAESGHARPIAGRFRCSNRPAASG